MGKLHGFLHVVVGYGVAAPSPLLHVVVAEAAVVDDDTLLSQVVDALDQQRLVLVVNHAVGENLDDRLSVLRVVVVEVGVHAAHQVGTASLQVVQSVLGRFQLDFVGNVQLPEDKAQQVNVVAHRLARVVEEGVGPQVPGILVDQRLFLGIGAVVIVTCSVGRHTRP